jgi:transposase
MKSYAGIDLHSTNNYVGIIDDQDQKLYGKRLPNELNSVLMALDIMRQLS